VLTYIYKTVEDFTNIIHDMRFYQYTLKQIKKEVSNKIINRSTKRRDQNIFEVECKNFFKALDEVEEDFLKEDELNRIRLEEEQKQERLEREKEMERKYYKMGIYKIVNAINNNIYIGQSIFIKNRWTQHRDSLRSTNHTNKGLQCEWNEFGEDNFIFERVERVKDRKLLSIRERFWIEKLNADGYNLYNSTMPIGEHAYKVIQLENKIKELEKKLERVG
jgi:hypothetical protein